MDEGQSFDASFPTDNEKVVINVGGLRHETYSTTLKSIPDTRLYWITENPTQLAEYDPDTHEYFFDRHPGVFAQVLNFYRTGKLHCPNDVCGPLFEEELAFWGIDELQVEPCCWLNFKKHREAQAHLDPIEGRESDGESIEDMDMTIYGLVGDSIRRRNRTRWKTYQPKIWTLFEEPYSSIPAQIIAFLTLFLILTSVAVFCMETMPYFSDPNETPFQVIYYIEVVCVAAFTLEFFIRLAVCPNKLYFLKVPMNWIDFAAILPFYLQLMLNKSNVQTMVVFRVIRLVRVFRIFKLSRHSYGLQILGHTLKSSCSELFLLAFFLSIGVIIFSSIIYYAERDEKTTHFKTIPHGFWWAVVTMTTLGYGDMVPQTTQGKIVGSLCAVSGVLMIALPIPVIVSNFSLYYSHAKARMMLPKRKRPLIFGAASALRVAQPFAVSDHKPNVITQLMDERKRDDDDSDNPSIVRHSPRISGRFNSISHIKSPRNLHPSSTVATPNLSPRGSFVSPQEPKKNPNPEIHSNVDSSEQSSPKKSSCVVHSIPQVVLPSSGELSPNHHSSHPKSPLSVQMSDGSATSLTEKLNHKSPSMKKRAIQVKSLSTESSHGGSPRGRRGRRGSIYIVGFTAKHWQNKALSKHKERKALSADNSTEKDESKSRGMYYSLSCENCDPNRKALSAEVLLRSDLQGSDRAIENVSPGCSPRRNSITIQNNPRIVTHKNLTRVSSGTQTSDTPGIPGTGDIPGIKDIVSKESRKTLSDPVRKSSKSLVEHDTLSKPTDDSLCVHRNLCQRRGSSPLRRQHAVFTFDVNEKTSPQLNPSVAWQHQANKLAPIEVVNQATSPILPSMIEIINISGSRDHQSDKSTDSPSPPLPDGRINSGRNSKVRPKSMPSSYVNASYQKEDEDSVLQNAIPRSQSSITCCEDHDGSITNSTIIEKRGFQPYQRDYEVVPTVATPGETHPDEPELDDFESKDQYSRGRRTPLGSVSNASLPSISEEQVDAGGTTTSSLQGKHILHRPHSMPSKSFENPFPISPNIIRTSSLTNLKPSNHDDNDDVESNFLHPAHAQMRENSKTLLQRRQGPDLSLNSADLSLELKKHLVKYPWFQNVMNSSGTYRTIDGVNAVISSFDNFTSGQSPLTSGEYPLSADERLLFSPHTPPSSLITSKTRDMATSPFITVWNENEDPGLQPVEHHSHPFSRQISGETESRLRSTSSPSEVDSLEEDDKRKSSEVQLRPIRRVEGQDGREYTLYAVPTGLEGSVYYSSVHTNSDDIVGTQSSSNENRHRIGEEISGLPSESVRDHFELPSERDRDRFGRPSESVRDHYFELPSERDQDRFGIPSEKVRDHSEGVDSKRRSDDRLQRTENTVIYNSHEPLQQKLSGNLLLTKRPTSLPSPDRRKARILFFGDSGISSVGSGSTTSISHSLELDTDSKDRKENAANILNPIKETDVENPGNRSITKRIDSEKTSQVNILLMKSMKSRDSTVVDILANADLYEASVV